MLSHIGLVPATSHHADTSHVISHSDKQFGSPLQDPHCIGTLNLFAAWQCAKSNALRSKHKRVGFYLKSEVIKAVVILFLPP